MANSTSQEKFDPIKYETPKKMKEELELKEDSIIDKYPVSQKNWIWIVIYFTLFLAGVLGVVGYRMVLAK